MSIKTVEEWYDHSYSTAGLRAQRYYPNEELLRFFGRYYFPLPQEERARLRVLEVGCGSCSNLWMIAREGFEAHGLDLSQESLTLGKQMLSSWNVDAELRCGSMTALAYPDGYFDSVCDVFSSYCLDVDGFHAFVQEAHRVLRPGGRVFIYTPSVNSDAFIDHAPARRIDEFTLDGIRRPNSPFAGNHYPFRFCPPAWLEEQLAGVGFITRSCELITRTYGHMREQFQHISLSAERP